MSDSRKAGTLAYSAEQMQDVRRRLRDAESERDAAQARADHWERIATQRDGAVDVACKRAERAEAKVARLLDLLDLVGDAVHAAHNIADSLPEGTDVTADRVYRVTLHAVNALAAQVSK